jgi:hypothetical protein
MTPQIDERLLANDHAIAEMEARYPDAVRDDCGMRPSEVREVYEEMWAYERDQRPGALRQLWRGDGPENARGGRAYGYGDLLEDCSGGRRLLRPEWARRFWVRLYVSAAILRGRWGGGRSQASYGDCVCFWDCTSDGYGGSEKQLVYYADGWVDVQNEGDSTW